MARYFYERREYIKRTQIRQTPVSNTFVLGSHTRFKSRISAVVYTFTLWSVKHGTVESVPDKSETESARQNVHGERPLCVVDFQSEHIPHVAGHRTKIKRSKFIMRA